MSLEEMGAFFNNRVGDYEQHMMNDVVGKYNFYFETAKLIPLTKDLNLLDLGCGTGLELDEIFKINPTVRVTGIDLAKDMVEKLKQKHKDKLNQIKIVIDNYFEYDFGESIFDAAVSVQSLHHFSHEDKINLYKKILRSLKGNGLYIETDYMAPDQEYEEYHFNENRRIRSELGITDGFYHYDTPCTVENQIQMMYSAGFKSVEMIGKYENTVILTAYK